MINPWKWKHSKLEHSFIGIFAWRNLEVATKARFAAWDLTLNPVLSRRSSSIKEMQCEVDA